MTQYLGIVKKETIGMVGKGVRIITKTSSSKEEIEKWKNNYSKEDSIIIEYEEKRQEEMENFFLEFEDIAPKTAKEKQEARELYESLMKN